MTVATKKKIKNWSTLQEEHALIAQAKLLRVFDMIRLLRTPHHITTIATKLKCTTRTAYRYVHLVEAFGIKVSRDQYNNYFMVVDKCPCCCEKFSPPLK